MADVSGAVTIDGELAPLGSSISFIPLDGASPTAGATLIDGKYVTRVPIGMNRVEIRAPRPMKNQRPVTEGPGSEGPGGDLVVERLPTKYNNDSELTFDVQPGTNEKNWELTSQ